MDKNKQIKAMPRPDPSLWQWAKDHRLISATLALVVALIPSYEGYIYTGADSLRSDIYEPLLKEVGAMDGAIHSDNMETTYSTDVYQRLTADGSLKRIPEQLRAKIIKLYTVQGEATGDVTPIAHKISVLVAPEIAKIRTQKDDAAWTQKTLAQLNADSNLNTGSFSMASFALNHVSISPAVDIRDPAHLRYSAPGTILWLAPDWITFPASAGHMDQIWKATWYLGLDEKDESWHYRITRDDLARNGMSLEDFLRPTYAVIARDPQFQQLQSDSQIALYLSAEVKSSLADRVENPKQLGDLLDLF